MRAILQSHFKLNSQINDSGRVAQQSFTPCEGVARKSGKNQRKSNFISTALSQAVAMRYIEETGQQPLDFFGSGKRVLGAGPEAPVYGNPFRDDLLN